MISIRSNLRPIRQCLQCSISSKRFVAATPEFLPESNTQSPTLSRMRADLKDALRAKDTNRLNVLRGFLAAADSASKSQPGTMDSESRILALLNKHAKCSRTAAAEFGAAKRNDLKNKEEAQLAVLEGYMSLIPTVPDDEVSQAITKILFTLKSNGNNLHFGNVMRDLSGRNGLYADRPLDMDSVQRMVKERLEGIQ